MKKEDNNKKWLTCQITPAENTILETYCRDQGVSKTEVVRDFLQNLPVYAKIVREIKHRLSEDVLAEVERGETII